MLVQAARQARAAGITNVDWLRLRAEELPADLGPFRVATLAQSFHWMDRLEVARRLHRTLGVDGALVHVHATTHEGVEGDLPLPHPRPPRRAIGELVTRFLGAGRRAGRSILPAVSVGEPAVGRLETQIYRNAGFTDPTRVEVPGSVVARSADEVVASVFSLSSAAPHLFGARAPQFEASLRDLLADASPDGLFSEQMRDIAADIWHR